MKRKNRLICPERLENKKKFCIFVKEVKTIKNLRIMRFTRDDIKISFDKPVYYVNEEKKTVVCILGYKALIPQASFMPKSVTVDEYGYWTGPIGKLGFCDFEGSVTTKAKCHGDDVFDPEIGCDIAFARAENAAYSEVSRVVAEYENALNEYLAKIQAFQFKASSHNFHNDEYIADMSEKSAKVNPEE